MLFTVLNGVDKMYSVSILHISMEINKKNILIAVCVILLVVLGWNVYGKGRVLTTVVGTGSISVPVGQVSMVVTATTAGGTAGDSISANEQLMTNLVNATKKMLGNETEISKTFYQLTPESEGRYITASGISLKSSNVTKTSDLIRFLYSNGASSISAVTFIPKDIENTEKQVRLEAVKDAKLKAEAIAKAAGKKLGKLVSITDDGVTLGGIVNDIPGFDSSFKTVKIDKKLTIVFEIN